MSRAELIHFALSPFELRFACWLKPHGCRFSLLKVSNDLKKLSHIYLEFAQTRRDRNLGSSELDGPINISVILFMIIKLNNEDLQIQP